MSRYTIQLRKVCEYYTREEVENWFKSYQLSDYLLPTQLELLENSPIWSKDKLAKKIVDAYYMREIGFETPYLFRHYAIAKMNQLMQEYLPLIYTTAIEYDPLINVDFTETFEREAEGSAQNQGNSKSQSNNNASGLSVSSDTPQGQINKAIILAGNYASFTSASETESNINDNTDTTSSGSSENKEKYIKNVKGNSGVSATYQKMIEQFRNNVRAYDGEIIEKCSDLFMGIY